MGEPEQKKLFWIYRRRHDNVIMDIKPIGYDGVWIELIRHRFSGLACVSRERNLRVTLRFLKN